MEAWGSLKFWRNLGESPSDPQPAPWDWAGKWIKALESGNYQQGNTKLRPNKNQFCCLGVLADTIDPNLWEFSENGGYYDWAGQYGIANELELKKRGIKLSYQKQKYFYWLNDTHNWSFAQIAEMIREQQKTGELYE